MRYRRKKKVGFVFDFKNRRLGTSRTIGEEEMRMIPKTKRSIVSADYVHCVRCDTYMDFVEGPTDCLDGKWVCPGCGSTVKERSAARQISREIERLDKMLFDLDTNPDWNE